MEREKSRDYAKKTEDIRRRRRSVVIRSDDRSQELMTMTTKIETVTLTEDTAAGGTLPAGTYLVEMPVDYDPARITGEDILLDPALRDVTGEVSSAAVLDQASKALRAAGYDSRLGTLDESLVIDDAAPDSGGRSTEPGSAWDEECDVVLAEIQAIVRPHGCTAEWVDDAIHVVVEEAPR